MKSLSPVRLFATPWTIAYQGYNPWDFLGKNTEVGCHFLLQGIFLTQKLKPGLLHCRQILYQLSYKGTREALYIHKVDVNLDFSFTLANYAV